MKLDQILNDSALKGVRPEVRQELVKLSKMAEGKAPMELFMLITSFQKNLESRGLLNAQEKQVLTRAIENSLSPEEKRKVMGILSMLKNR